MLLHQPDETRHFKSSLPVSLDYPRSYRGLVMFGISKCLKVPDERRCLNVPFFTQKEHSLLGLCVCVYISINLFYSHALGAHLGCNKKLFSLLATGQDWESR